MTLLLTGGHLTPALALIQYIEQSHPKTKLFFVGRQFTRVAEKQRSREQQEVEKYPVTFIPFTTGKFMQGSWLNRVKETWLFILSIFQAIVIVGRYKPDAVVSFGSYLAVPIALAAWVWRVPAITHEQTRTAGFANMLISRLAQKVAISHPESGAHFPKRKTVLTGNLLRTELFSRTAAQPSWIPDHSKPLLYITGGSQGSEIINATVAQCLPQLLKNWTVIHQCGNPTQARNYKQELQAVKRGLAPIHRKRYVIREWVTAQELSWIYANAAGVVSRAGANTTEELARAGVPAVLIPLPFSHHDEQLLNAKALQKAGGAVVLLQQHITPEALIHALTQLQTEQSSLRAALKKISFPKNPEAALFRVIQEVVG